MNSLNSRICIVLFLSAWALGCGKDNKTHGINDSGSDADIDAGTPACHDLWEKVGDLPEGFYVTSAWGSGPKDLFAVATDDYNWSILYYDGSEWTPMDLGTVEGKVEFAAIWGASSSDVFMVGSLSESHRGFISHYDGSDWTIMDTGIEFSLSHWDWADTPIWGSASNDVFVVAGGGTVLHYNGDTWSLMDSGIDNDLITVWGTASNDVFAGGFYVENNSGVLFHYDGQHWKSMDNIEMDMGFGIAAVLDIWASSSNDIYARVLTDIDGGIAYLHYDGRRWTFAFICDDLSFENDVWGTGSSNVYALCTSTPSNSDEIDTVFHFDGTISALICTNGSEYLDSMYFYLIYGTSENDVFYFSSNAVYHSNGYSQ